MTHLLLLRVCTLLTLGPGLAAAAAAQGLSADDVLAGTHVHGLALKGPTRLLVATHHGLFATDLLSRRAEGMAGDPTDFMGFGAVPGTPDAFLASGHPPEGGNLGVVSSTDGGATWEALSPGAGGPVDFHQMDVSKADPQLAWGVHHGAVLQRSRDGGASWDEVGPTPEGIIDLAASARDPEMLFAATEGGLLVSRDGGLAWEAAHPARAPVTVVDVGGDGRIMAFVLGEGLVAANEAALDWEVLSDAFGGSYPLHLARDAAEPDRIVAATGDGRLMMSTDGGAEWATFAVPAS